MSMIIRKACELRTGSVVKSGRDLQRVKQITIEGDRIALDLSIVGRFVVPFHRLFMVIEEPQTATARGDIDEDGTVEFTGVIF